MVVCLWVPDQREQDLLVVEDLVLAAVDRSPSVLPLWPSKTSHTNYLQWGP